MPRIKKELSEAADYTHIMSVGHVAKVCPRSLILRTLSELGKQSLRVRLFPAHEVVYFVILMSLWRDPRQEEILRIISQCLGGMFEDYGNLKLPTKGAITKAREKLGDEVMESLAKEIIRPVATPGSEKAFYEGLRIVSLEKTTIDLPDSKANQGFFSPDGTKSSAYPQCKLVYLLESSSRVIFETIAGPEGRDDSLMAEEILKSASLKRDMLLISEATLFDPILWEKALEKGSSLLWELPKDISLSPTRSFIDKSYSVSLEGLLNNPERSIPGEARVIEYDSPQKGLIRLLTSLTDAGKYPAKKLIEVYDEHIRKEPVFSEIRARIGTRKTIVKSKVPMLVKQEIWGVIILHYAIRELLSSVTQRPLPKPFEERALISSVPENPSILTSEATLKDEALKSYGFSY
jgi:hypothetical protein